MLFRSKGRAKNDASKLFHFLPLVSFLARPKPRISFLGLSLLRNSTETLATQARRDSTTMCSKITKSMYSYVLLFIFWPNGSNFVSVRPTIFSYSKINSKDGSNHGVVIRILLIGCGFYLKVTFKGTFPSIINRASMATYFSGLLRRLRPENEEPKTKTPLFYLLLPLCS